VTPEGTPFSRVDCAFASSWVQSACAVAASGEQGVVELLGVNGYSMLLSAVMNGARTAPADPVAEPLRHFPD